MRGTLSTVLVGVALFSMLSPSGAQVLSMADRNVAELQSLDREQTVIVIPGGILEEHGPFLPNFTDGHTSQRLTNRVAEEITRRTARPVLVFPMIPLGVGSPEDFGGRQPFSGSYTVRPSTLRAAYMDVADALGQDGFRWVFVIHPHGSPSHNRALLQASEYFRDTFGGDMVVLSAYRYTASTDRPPIWTDADAEENAGDVHAGASETSRMLFLRPQLVDGAYAEARPQSAPSGDDMLSLARVDDWPGYFGSPRIASASAGAEIMARMEEDYIELALRVLGGFNPYALPTRAEAGEGAFRVLDENLIQRSQATATRQENWLEEHNLD